MKVTAPVDRGQWEEIADGDPGAVAEHYPRWVDAIAATAPWEDATRLYELADGRRFVLPLVRHRRVPGGWFASPPPAWGFGGLVGADLDADVVHAVVEDLRSLGALRISIRPDPVTGEGA